MKETESPCHPTTPQALIASEFLAVGEIQGMEYSRWEALCETEVVGALSRPRAPLRAQTPPDVREQGDRERNTEKRYVCVDADWEDERRWR